MRILLVADVHIRPFAKQSATDKTLRGLQNAIQKANADLIVFLGDIVHGPDFQKSNEPYEKYLRRVLDCFLSTAARIMTAKRAIMILLMTLLSLGQKAKLWDKKRYCSSI